MDREEIPDVVPLLAIVAVVQLDDRGVRLTQTIAQCVRQAAGLNGDDLERGRFEWFDKTGGVPHGHNVAHPGSFVAAGPEFYNARLSGDLWIFLQELCERLVIVQKARGIN